jgi:hypothetical protein
VDAPYTECCGVLSAQGVWSGLGDDLGHALGPRCQVHSKPSKVGQDTVYLMRETDARSVVTLRSQNVLENTEKYPSARDGEDHRPELAEHLLPLFNGCSPLRRRDGIHEL